jgi:hypothetical protein
MKPITISAMVAGVQAGRISAVVFIFSRSFRCRQPHPAVSIDIVMKKRQFKPTPPETGQAIETR